MQSKEIIASRGPSAVALVDGLTLAVRQGTKLVTFHTKPWRQENQLDVEEYCSGPVWGFNGTLYELYQDKITKTDTKSMYQEEISFDNEFPIQINKLRWFASESILYGYVDFVFYKIDPQEGIWTQLNTKPQNTRLQSSECHPEWLNQKVSLCALDQDTVLLLGQGVGAKYVLSQNKFKLFKTCINNPGTIAMRLNDNEVTIVSEGRLMFYNHSTNRIKAFESIKGSLDTAFPGVGKGIFGISDANGQVQVSFNDIFQIQPVINMVKQETQTGVDQLSFIMELTEQQKAEQAAIAQSQAAKKREIMARLGGFV